MRYVVKLGALWLLILGVLLMLTGWLVVFLGATFAGVTCAGGATWCDDGLVSMAFGLLVLAVSVAHLAAFVGVWTRRSWARWLGAVIAFAGIVICAALMSAMSADWEGVGWSLLVVPGVTPLRWTVGGRSGGDRLGTVPPLELGR